MANSGVLGKRAKDGQGRLSLSNKFVQTVYPIPSITRFVLDGLDDTALDTAGGQTVVITGTNFASGATVVVGGNTIGSVTVVNTTTITFTSEARSSGTYTVFVVNPDGGTAILAPGLIYSGLPTFTTAAGSLGTYYETTAISETIEATEGADVISYSVVSGSLPPGATFASNGVLTGTAPVESASTTYTFTVEATDEELQSSTRQFSLTINADVVTWVSPNEGSIPLEGDTAMSAITLSATSAAGYGVSYAADALPTGVALANGVVSGTPTVEETVATTFTATAATTGRSATRTVTFVVSLGDAYFKATVLLLNGDVNTFITDASDNSLTLTPSGDVRPSAFSPYNTNWSNYFDGSGDYFSIPASSAFNLGTGDFTFELWLYIPSGGAGAGQLLTLQPASGNSFFQWFIDNSNGSTTWGINNIGNFGTSGAVPLNTWTHLALTRSGNTLRQFTNGVKTYESTNFTYTIGSATQAAFIGRDTGAYNNYLRAYLSNFRIIKGTALYTSTFTPPTEPLTAITNTSLLTCQSNRFVDNSTNNFTITKTGDVKVTSFSPFISSDVYGSAYCGYNTGYLTTQTGHINKFYTTTGDFTVEAWCYPLSFSGPQYSCPIFGVTPVDRLLVRANPTTGSITGVNLFVIFADGSAINQGGATNCFTLNKWHHVAVCRKNGVFKLFVDGKLELTNSSNTSKSMDLGSDRVFNIGKSSEGANPFWNGYISDVRAVKGEALYDADFTPPTSSLTAIPGTALLTCQNRIGYNNSQPIDESGVKNIITRNGNVSMGTFSPFAPSGWSAYFDGSGDYLSTPSSAGLTFGTGDFTIEGWFYVVGSTDNKGIFMLSSAAGGLQSSSSNNLALALDGNNSRYIVYAGNQDLRRGPPGPILSGWTHFALVRTSSITKLYINGSQVGENITDTVNYSASYLAIGGYYSTSYLLNGYISNFRVVKGTAVYTSNFTPSTEPLTAITNTSLLTCQSPTVIDNSTNAFAITANGNTSIQPFSPFKPHTVTPDSYSVYFDGNGDYLSAPVAAEIIVDRTGNFTAECWIYTVSTQGQTLFYINGNDTSYAACRVGLNANKVSFLVSTTGSSWQINSGDVGPISLNQWHHIAVVRNGNNFTLYVDGTSVYNSTAISSSTQLLSGTRNWIGAISSSGVILPFYGQISNARVVKGTAVYTSNFTPPTTPLTAIANTTVLTCQSPTVVDNSANSFTITVNGNSQPTKFNPFGETVTSSVAYNAASHGGSGYFDGTGDYLTVPSHLTGSGDFTVEFWAYFNSFSNEVNVVGLYSGNYTTGVHLSRSAANPQNGLSLWVCNASITAANTITLLNRWYHIAATRKSGTARLFVDGVQVATGTLNGSILASTVYIGTSSHNIANEEFTGYISNLRVVNGTAVYTAAFTPPTAPPTAIANTSLLLNFTNAGILDNTGRNVLETVGTAQVSTTQKKYGSGSLYFNGTGNYATLPPGPQFAYGTGDFTVEGWVYLTANPPNYVGIIFAQTVSGTNYFLIGLGNNTNASVRLLTFFFATSGAGTQVSSATQLELNTWNHFALVRSSGVAKVYLNGVAGTGVSCTQNFNNTTYVPTFGRYSHSGDNAYTGYIDDFRITKYARYTSNFTPPTSAFSNK